MHPFSKLHTASYLRCTHMNRENYCPGIALNICHRSFAWKWTKAPSVVDFNVFLCPNNSYSVQTVQNKHMVQTLLKYYSGLKNLIMTWRGITLKIWSRFFFSARIEIHRFIKGKLPQKSRCKILSARFLKTQFSLTFLYIFECLCISLYIRVGALKL